MEFNRMSHFRYKLFDSNVYMQYWDSTKTINYFKKNIITAACKTLLTLLLVSN